MSLDYFNFYVIFLGIGMLAILGLWFYYEFRDRNLYIEERMRSVYHCIKCGHLYASSKSDKPENCPECDFENDKLRF